MIGLRPRSRTGASGTRPHRARSDACAQRRRVRLARRSPCALVLLATIARCSVRRSARRCSRRPGRPTSGRASSRLLGVRPEPTEHARYVLALLGPLLVVGGVLALADGAVPSAFVTVARARSLEPALRRVRRRLRRRPARRRHVRSPSRRRGSARRVFFTLPTLVVGAAARARSPWSRCCTPGLAERVAARDARDAAGDARRAIAVAALFVATWLLTAFNTDGTIDIANVGAVRPHALLRRRGVRDPRRRTRRSSTSTRSTASCGRTWPPARLTLLGASLGVYAASCWPARRRRSPRVFATFRRVARQLAARARASFLPFVATSFFIKLGPLENRYGPANLFSLFPIRYAGPYVLLWLVVRRLRQRRRRGRRSPLLALAGLVAINNVEFGLPALGATLVALAVARAGPLARGRSRGSRLRRSRASRSRSRSSSALTLARRAARCRTSACCSTFPQHLRRRRLRRCCRCRRSGFHLVALRDVRRRDRRRDGARRSRRRRDAAHRRARVGRHLRARRRRYFVGRSHPHVLIDLFSAWRSRWRCCSIVVVRAIARRPARRPTLAELLVLAGFGVDGLLARADADAVVAGSSGCGDTTPSRMTRSSRPSTEVVDQLTSRGEPVALLRQARAPDRRRARPRQRHPVRQRRLDDDRAAVGGDDRRAAAARRRERADRPARRAAQEQLDWLAGAGCQPDVERQALAPHSLRRSAAPSGAARARRSAAVERALEPLDRLDRRRVDPAQDGQVERDEVAEQDERDEPLDARLAAALDAERGAPRSRRSGRASARSAGASRGCRSESSRKTAVKRPSSAAPLQPTSSLWSSSGSSAANAGHLGVLVELRLPAVGDRRGQAGAGDLRHRAVQAARELLGERVLGAVRAPLGDELLGVRGGDVDLRVQRLGRRRTAAATSSAITSM